LHTPNAEAKLKNRVLAHQNAPLEEPADDPTLVEKMIETNKTISTWFDGTIEKVDLFLVGKSKSNIRNNSSLQVINTTESFEGSNFNNNTTISINPKLPNLERFLKINLSTYVERDAYLRSQRDLKDDEIEIETVRSEAGELWNDLLTFDAYFEPRIELRDPLRISNTLGFKSGGKYGNLEVDPKIEFFADALKGVGIFHGLNFKFELGETVDLRFLNEAEYEDRLHLYTVNNGVTLNHTVSSRDELGYGIVFTSVNQPNYNLKSYRTFFIWSHSIYKKVLDFQLVPQVEFERIKNFKGVAGVTFNMIVSF